MATGRGPGSAPCAHPGPRPPPHCPPRALVAAALGILRGRFCRITGLRQNRPRFFYSPRKFCADRGFTPGAAASLFPFGRQRREHPRAFYVSRSAALASTPSIPPWSRVFDGCAAAGCPARRGHRAGHPLPLTCGGLLSVPAKGRKEWYLCCICTRRTSSRRRTKTACRPSLTIPCACCAPYRLKQNMRSRATLRSAAQTPRKSPTSTRPSTPPSSARRARALSNRLPTTPPSFTPQASLHSPTCTTFPQARFNPRGFGPFFWHAEARTLRGPSRTQGAAPRTSRPGHCALCASAVFLRPSAPVPSGLSRRTARTALLWQGGLRRG